jgi:hypothetical protein
MSKRKLRILRSIAYLFIVSGGVLFMYGWSLGTNYKACLYDQKQQPNKVCDAAIDNSADKFAEYGWPIFMTGILIGGYGEKRYGQTIVKPLPMKPPF